MLPIKKSLKLSRSHGQKLEKAGPVLDDSLDDFIVARPLRTERKAAKENGAPISKLVIDHETTDKDKPESSSANICENIAEKVRSSSKLSSSTAQSCSASYEVIGSNPTQPTVCEEFLSTARSFQDKEHTHLSSPILLQAQIKRVSEKRRGNRKRVADPSDLSLALALSESLQSANEMARKYEEELLLTENLAEVISDLRNEEQSAGVLSHVFPTPVEAPVTKVKRKAKATSKTKDPAQYTLVLRSQTERDRLIADRAASILTQEPTDPLKPSKSYFNHPQPVSEFIRQYSQEEKPLWQRASLSDIATADKSDTFYVGALRSVLSPPKKKCGYSNILFHVSQLPGRNSSQVDKGNTISETQLLLEELACGAEGGFVDESNVQEVNSAVTGPFSSVVRQLTEDWSRLLDNPVMSDLIIRTENKDIPAHRLVFAVRFPKILEEVNQCTKTEKSILDWSRFSTTSVMKVLRFVYAAAYESDDADSRQVYRIARRYGMTELIELLPWQSERDSDESEESGLLESTSELDLTAATSPIKDVLIKNNSPTTNMSPNSPELTIVSEKIANTQDKKENDSLLSVTNFIQTMSPEKRSPQKSPLSKSSMLSTTDMLLGHQEEYSFIDEADEVEEIKEDNAGPRPQKSEEVVLPHLSGESRRPIRSSLSASDMEICSSNNTCNDRPAPLSPDMFQETLIESDEEDFSLSKSHENVIDLTQESSDHQSDRAVTPFANSCEMENSLHDKSVEDISMLECSVVSGPNNSLPKSPVDSLLQDTFNNQSVASRSQANPSFVNDSVSSWNCYQGGIDDVVLDCPSSVNVSDSPPRTKLAEISHEAAKRSNSPVEDEFPDELDSIFPQMEGIEPSPQRATAPLLPVPSRSSQVTDNNTPDPPRVAKKRKIDVTPLPDYQSMETPLLKQELGKYGLKPFKRSNAVKLLQHIYEELHPLVTDSESSFQDTPERPTVMARRRAKQTTAVSPAKSPREASSYDESESGHSQEDEESMIAMELDRELGSQSESPERSLPLKDRMKSFLQKRPDIYKMVLTYEPISFEYLFKEVRKERIRCKAQDLLDWLDEECITCRMKSRNRNGPATSRTTGTKIPNITPEKVQTTAPPATKPAPKARRVAKKLMI